MMFWLFEIGIVKSYEDYLTEKTFLEKWISYCESAFNPLFLAKFTEMMYNNSCAVDTELTVLFASIFPHLSFNLQMEK